MNGYFVRKTSMVISEMYDMKMRDTRRQNCLYCLHMLVRNQVEQLSPLFLLKAVLKQLSITYAVLRRWELFDLQAGLFLHFG